MARRLYMPDVVPGRETWQVKLCTGEIRKFVTRAAAESWEARRCDAPDCNPRNHDVDRVEE